MAKKKKKSPDSLAKWRADLTLSEPFGLVLTVCLPGEARNCSCTRKTARPTMDELTSLYE